MKRRGKPTTPSQRVSDFVDAQLAAGMSPVELRARVVMATLEDEDLCQFCGAMATRLCDYQIGIEITGEGVYRGGALGERKTYPTCSEASEFYTCDLRTCDDCTKFAGIMIHKPSQKTPPDHYDACPLHAGVPYKQEPVTPDGLRVVRGVIALQLRQWHEAKTANEIVEIKGGKK